jgi:hypothetical protein
MACPGTNRVKKVVSVEGEEIKKSKTKTEPKIKPTGPKMSFKSPPKKDKEVTPEVPGVTTEVGTLRPEITNDADQRPPHERIVFTNSKYRLKPARRAR